MAKKKKYHQSMHDRMDESRGMKMHMRKEMLEDRDLYSGYDERRALEAKHYDMISEDKTKIANLPQEVMMKEYPRFRYGLDPFLDDTINGVDDQMYADDSKMKKHISKSKY